MFKIIDKTIHLTRGDVATIKVQAKDENNEDYTFQIGDVVRLNVFKNKDCGCIEITKDLTVTTAGTSVDLSLTSEETTIGEVISKPVKYWYEIILNPDTSSQTIVGYDEDGAKEFILYPEGSEE